MAHLYGAAPRRLAGLPPAPAAPGPCTPALWPGPGASPAIPPAPPADQAQRGHGSSKDAATGKHTLLRQCCMHLEMFPDASAYILRLFLFDAVQPVRFAYIVRFTCSCCCMQLRASCFCGCRVHQLCVLAQAASSIEAGDRVSAYVMGPEQSHKY